MFTCLPTYLYGCLPVNLPSFLSVYLSTSSWLYLYTSPHVFLSAYPFMYLSTCLPVYLVTCLPVNLFTWIPVPAYLCTRLLVHQSMCQHMSFAILLTDYQFTWPILQLPNYLPALPVQELHLLTWLSVYFSFFLKEIHDK